MDKENIELIMCLYNQVFDNYANQVIWLCGKREFSQAKRFVISKDISKRMFIELLRVHECLKQEAGLPSLLDMPKSSKAV